MNKSGAGLSLALHLKITMLLKFLPEKHSHQLTSDHILIFKVAKTVSASLVKHNGTWKASQTDRFNLVLRSGFEK